MSAPWIPPPTDGLRRETHFGTRVLRCFADRPPSAYAMFEEALARHPEREALVSGTRRWRWSDLDQQTGRIATALAQRGIQAGDRVVLLLSNRPEFVLGLLAVLRLGAIAVPVSIREQAPGLAYVIGQCGARAILHDDALADRLPPDTSGGSLAVRLSASEVGHLGDAEEGTPALPAVHTAEDETMVILYTSGTTGKPKGALLSNLGIVHSSMHYERHMQLGPHDRSALAVPASHVTGLVAMITTMWRVGGTLVLVPEFKAGEFLALAARERITHTVLVPAMYALCLLQADRAQHDLSAWRIGCYGGAPMPRSTIEALAATWPGMTPMNAYGSTETTSPATLMPAGEQASHLDSVGRPVACCDIAVVDDEGKEVLPGATGELLIGGPMVVAGYWDNPQATEAGFVGGYWRSGDLGSIDAQGYVRIFDRKKDMINRGGYKIWSVEVENTLVGYPGVVEAAAVGVPCPVLGERVHAFVYLHPESAPRDAGTAAAVGQALRAYCAERLADYKVPESIGLRDAPLPRNANGKLLKREIREWLSATVAS